MQEKLRVLWKFPARSPRDILRRLADHAEAARTDTKKPSPVVSVFSTDGRAFTGTVLGLDGGRDESVLLHAPDAHDAGQGHVVYLSMAHVVSVRIHDAEQYAPLLSEGAVARVEGEEAPTRLQLKRDLQSLSQRLPVAIDADWEALPRTDPAHLNLRDLGSELETAVGVVTHDDLARAAWKKLRGISIRHEQGAQIGAKRHDTSITLTLDLSRALPSDLVELIARQITSVL